LTAEEIRGGWTPELLEAYLKTRDLAAGARIFAGMTRGRDNRIPKHEGVRSAFDFINSGHDPYDWVREDLNRSRTT
jgi:hypothetical protein